MSFKDYLWQLLPRPYKIKKDGEIPEQRHWVFALGEAFDRLKMDVFKVRRNWNIVTAQGRALDAHGKDRGLPRYPGETDESYKQRLLAAYETYALGGTDRGILRTLELLGYPDAVLHNLYEEEEKFRQLGGRLLDGEWVLDSEQALSAPEGVRDDWIGRWAEFALEMKIGDRSFTVVDYFVLQETIRTVKAAHSKLAELRFWMDGKLFLPLKTDWKAKITTPFINELAWHNPPQVLLTGATAQANVVYMYLDGAWILSGNKQLDGYIDIQGWTLDQKTLQGSIKLAVREGVLLGESTKDVWALNGGGPRYYLDGRWPLSSFPLGGADELDGTWGLGGRSLSEPRNLLDGVKVLGNHNHTNGIGFRGVLRYWERGVYKEELVA